MVILVVLLVSSTTQAGKTKKKNKKAKIVIPEHSSYKRKELMYPGLYCAGCQNLVRQVFNRLENYKTLESDVLEAMTHACLDPRRFDDDERYIPRQAV